MKTETWKRIIATLLTILLFVSIVIPLTQPIAVANDNDITDLFTDENFRNAVLNFMPENYICANVVAGITSLSVRNRSIQNLAGIERFTNLELLYADSNQIETLTLSGLPRLRELSIGRNQLRVLNLSNLPALTNLYVHDNQLEALNVSNVTALRSLVVRDNNLTTINVSSLRELRFLNIERNSLRSISDIVGLAGTEIHPLIEGQSWREPPVGGERYGFYFHPQNVVTSWPFIDVHHSDWFYDSVSWAYVNDIAMGFEGTSMFGPRRPVTRGQFVTFFYRFAGRPPVHGSHSFTDVRAGRYYSIAVAWAAETNVAMGYAGTTLFGPSDRISREQVVTMLHRYFRGSSPANALDGFIDRDSVSPWARNSMRWAVHNGIIRGSGSRLSPRDEASRAEVIAMLYRADRADRAGQLR